MYKNILAEMARKSMTRSDIAEHLNIAEPTLRKKLRGEQDFKISEITTLLSLFGEVSFEYLFEK